MIYIKKKKKKEDFETKDIRKLTWANGVDGNKRVLHFVLVHEENRKSLKRKFIHGWREWVFRIVIEE